MKAKQVLMPLLILVLWAAALMLPASRAQAGAVFTSIHSFQEFPYGANPYAGLVQASDGNFYGTTYAGGTNGGNGTVFKMSTNGVLTSLHSFSNGIDGANPFGGLVQGVDGSLYGTTEFSSTGFGTVFKITTNGALTTLYSFTGFTDGAYPEAGLVQGRDGNFYGTTYDGGTSNSGSVFQITSGGTLTNLYSFTGGNDGAYPEAGLVQAGDGNLYGTTYDGGTSNSGTVFQLGTHGELTTLYSFTGADDGSNPQDALVLASDGNFYGTTSTGGTNYYGTVFKIGAKNGLTSLYSFTGGFDGGNVSSGLVQASDGYLYGTTYNGGTNGDGTVFQISTNGALISLYSFLGGADGANPMAGLVQGSDGNLYGTTQYGSTNFAGTVFQITTHGSLTGRYFFPGGNDGSSPEDGLVQGSDGNFYGTTTDGGIDFFRGEGYGTVFQISSNGTLTSLYTFTGGNDGAYPEAGLIAGSDGEFYGTTFDAGSNGFGTLFQISTGGTLSSLHSFTGGNDGAYLVAGLLQGADGNFYGTTYEGGMSNSGTVFQYSPDGVLSNLYSFTGGNDGGFPEAGLVQSGDGNFFGTTYEGGTSNSGTVFQFSAHGELTTLYSFTGGDDGANPQGAMVLGSDGNFYGTTSEGGSNYSGTVFQIGTKSGLTSLYSFTGFNDGANPVAGLVQGSDGELYGTTEYGSTNDNGTVFKISTNGVLTTLYSFTGGNDGGYPQAALVQGKDGSFYGTTEYGGQGGDGTVFRLSFPGAAPEFQSVALTGGTLSLTWTTESGGMYQLQYNSSLNSTNWINVGGVLTATGTTLSTNESVTAGPPRFYRVALLP
jgi:uncharacterized repeat protein (TIGR03803 family)